MTLKHPTLADVAFERIRAREGPAHRICGFMGATVERPPGTAIHYTFDDDTTLVVRGRGRSQSFEVMMP